ncbi:uncharacterized protein LOC132739508 [Ruditapes philippinarum]|uniref:uncharacterized protein LOC132739508 n=1 Tax=Ruditapes philippinarum TaxID=129788 RepID=UPI00295AC679|nr:uncharacterized protein LOC132739508 [Ruditapes philippinarum]
MNISFIYGFLLVFAATTCGAVKETESQSIVSDKGKKITLNIVHKESEEDIDVLDDKGTPIIKVEIIEDDGYQVDKPANENVCLLSKLEEYENKSYCYDRMEYPSSNTSQKILDHCDGRSIYVLVPIKCRGEELEKDNETTPDDKG